MHRPKKTPPQKPCVWRKHCFFTRQSWPPSRKVDLHHHAEQKQSPSSCGFDTTEKSQNKYRQTKARLENKHLSKKNLFKEYF